MRPKHYLKNFLIFTPLIFSGLFFNVNYLTDAGLSFMAFSLIASTVYVINDINDRNLDKLHPKKKKRPIASGDVSVIEAVTVAVILVILAIIVQYFANPSFVNYGLLSLYLVLNVMYSLGLKNIPIVDVAILSFGFLIRVLYGGSSVGIEISKWLYLAILAFSFYMSLGKRRNEIKSNGNKTRLVNKYYSQEFLDKNMYMSMALAIIFYSLWSVDPTQSNKQIFWTVPVIMLISMTYSLSIEKSDSDGDPINVIVGNLPLLGLVAFYGILIMGLIYI